MSWTGIGTYPSLGLYAVYAFFMLSSVTLCLVYAEAFSETVVRSKLMRFAMNRAARILPLLCAAAVLTFALRVLQGGQFWHEAQSALLTATGVFAFGAPGLLANATGAWSVGVEIMFYFLFPILCLLLLSRSVLSIIGLAIALLIVQNINTGFVLGAGSLADSWNTYTVMLSFGYYFVAGFAIYRIRFNARFGLIAGLVLLLLTVGISYVVHATEAAILLPPYGFIIPILMGAAILLIYNSTAHPSVIRVFEFLGAISYSSYLLHPLIYTVVAGVARRLHLSLASLTVAFAIATLAIAYMSYRLFEMPMRNWLRRIGGTPPVTLGL